LTNPLGENLFFMPYRGTAGKVPEPAFAAAHKTALTRKKSTGTTASPVQNSSATLPYLLVEYQILQALRYLSRSRAVEH
jgi:hypothetical protein